MSEEQLLTPVEFSKRYDNEVRRFGGKSKFSFSNHVLVIRTEFRVNGEYVVMDYPVLEKFLTQSRVDHAVQVARNMRPCIEKKSPTPTKEEPSMMIFDWDTFHTQRHSMPCLPDAFILRRYCERIPPDRLREIMMDAPRGMGLQGYRSVDFWICHIHLYAEVTLVRNQYLDKAPTESVHDRVLRRMENQEFLQDHRGAAVRREVLEPHREEFLMASFAGWELTFEKVMAPKEFMVWSPHLEPEPACFMCGTSVPDGDISCRDCYQYSVESVWAPPTQTWIEEAAANNDPAPTQPSLFWLNVWLAVALVCMFLFVWVHSYVTSNASRQDQRNVEEGHDLPRAAASDLPAR